MYEGHSEGKKFRDFENSRKFTRKVIILLEKGANLSGFL